MDTTKFKILEVIIKNRGKKFDDIQVALINEFREMSWEEIKGFIYILKKEGYIAVLNGDNTILEVRVQPTTLARLRDEKEKAENENVKEIINRILQIGKVMF